MIFELFGRRVENLTNIGAVLQKGMVDWRLTGMLMVDSNQSHWLEIERLAAIAAAPAVAHGGRTREDHRDSL